METPKIVEIAKDIYWVGGSGQAGGLHCNPYLILDGDEAVLIDPGSVLDFEYVYENVCNIVPLEKIKYVILHHQDPDFCSSVPLFEEKGAKFKIVTHWRTETVVKYYGIKSEYYIVNKNEFRLVLKSGRVLEFIQTPYLHFAGAITTFDEKTKILFSSDLFGAFSYEWSMYAGDDYVEKMKVFHEHYMPSNDIIRPVMEVFLGMDILMIAPQHGSVIKHDVKKYIKALRDLECGSFITPIKKDIAKSGGYKIICSTVLKRFAAIFNIEEVLQAIEGMDISLSTNLEIEDYNYTGIILWDLIFEKVLAKKGLEWLMVIEPLVQTLSKEYEIPMPSVFETNLKKVKEESKNLNKENEMLKEINNRLQHSLQETEDKLTRCPVTGLYNFEFLKNYLLNELNGIIADEVNQNPGLIVISLDDIGKIAHSYGESVVDETLKYTVYILQNLKSDNDILFKLEGTILACYIQHTTKESIVSFAEKIRNLIAISEKFIEKITVSIGVVTLDEIRESYQDINDPDEILYNISIMRLRLAESMGKNIVCSNSMVDNYQEDIGQILLVDTEEINIDVLKTFLENLNFKVLTAGDGEEALRIVNNNSINLIVSEVMLPKFDGFILREKLLAQSNTKNIPFIIISHLKDDDSVNIATKLDIDHYFKKPFMLSEFLGVVKNKIKGESYR